MPKEGLTAPNNLHIAKKDKLQITWDTAYAADAPIATYEVYQDDRLIGSIRHTPQISRDPFLFQANADSGHFKVVTVDTAGNRAASEPIQV